MQEVIRGANLIIKGDQQLGGVYLGSVKIARNQQILKQNNIKSVLSIISNYKITYSQDINHLKIQLQDDKGQNISKFFEQTYNFIEQSRKKSHVVIHCLAGISRSATITIAYLMRKNKMDLQTAFAFVKEKRKNIHPNNGFKQQLKQFEKTLNL